jgi:glycosyltransferase involved in cell wall biosynthesis
MAAGVPVVVTDVGAVAEVVHDGVNGRVVAPDDPDALTAAIAALAGGADERARLGRAGRVAAAHQASPEAFATVQMAAYELAVRRHRRPLPPERSGVGV